MAFNFVKKIWEGDVDESAHSQFIRFSKGFFDNKAVISLSRNGKVKLNSTFEYATDLVLFVASLVEKASVSGIFLSRQNPESLLNEAGLKSEVKKRSNIFQAEVNAELTSEQLTKITSCAYFILFDVLADGIELKIKKKLPQPSKSNSGRANDKFCILNADIKFWQSIRAEFAFGLGEFKKARIVHKFDIKDVILPQGEKDFEQMRLKAKKKGILTRQITVDGRTMQQEKNFEA